MEPKRSRSKSTLKFRNPILNRSISKKDLEQVATQLGGDTADLDRELVYSYVCLQKMKLLSDEFGLDPKDPDYYVKLVVELSKMFPGFRRAGRPKITYSEALKLKHDIAEAKKQPAASASDADAFRWLCRHHKDYKKKTPASIAEAVRRARSVRTPLGTIRRGRHRNSWPD